MLRSCRVAQTALIILLALIFSCGVGAKEVVSNGKAKDEIFLQASLSTSAAYVGEMVVYEVAVYSPVESIALLGISSQADFGSLDYRVVDTRSGFSKVKFKGHEMYRAVLSRILLSSSSTGEFTLPALDFVLGLPRERIVRDPFFGNMRSSYYDRLSLTAPSVSFRVSDFPETPSSFDFSGAVDDYEVSVFIPEGYIAAGEEAIAIVNISGEGNLSGADAPALLKAFSGTVRLKSVSEERSHYVKDGKIISEMELEVTFVPHPDEEGLCRIGEVEFGYFSPEKKKFMKSVSSPVDVPLDSFSGKSTPPVSIGV